MAVEEEARRWTTRNRAERDRGVRRALIITGCANVVVVVAKAVVGITTGSMAILSEAVHSLTDAANNLIALIIIHHSAQPPDREHPYGHRKYETLAVFCLGVVLTVLAFELAIRALQREEHEVSKTSWELVLMISVLATNIGVTLWERYQARRLKSDILLADSRHTLGDVFMTLVVIIGWQFAAAGHVWLDVVVTIAVALLVLYLAFDLFKRVVPVLVDRMAFEPEELTEAVAAVDGVQEVRSVRSRWIGQTAAIDVVVSVAPDLSTVDAHEIADAIENRLQDDFAADDITVHIEPHR